MRVFLERDEPRVLPIPYWTKGEPGRRFWNLKKDPALVRRVAELRGCPELRAFVAGINGPKSRLATLGCDHWVEPFARGGGAHEAGLYVDLVFDRLGVAAKKKHVLELVGLVRARDARGPREATTVIRLQPQRVHFRGLLPDTAWMLSVWAFGSGGTRAVARARRRRALDAVRAACAAMSREIERRFGRSGTPVPP